MPYWRLSGFYLFYFASLGALVPYWSLYLKSLGFSSLEIGQLMAILMATKIISPNIWGWIADHTGKRMAVVRWGSFLAVVTFCGVFLAKAYWPLALVMLLFSFFWNAALPQFEATTLSHLGKESHRYSMIRLWGSIGFIVAVAGLGPLLDWAGPALLPSVLLVMFLAIWGSSLAVPERDVHALTQQYESLGSILRRPEVLALLAVCFLVQASHGPYYTFYTIYMEEFGYSRGVIGQFWALGVIAEVLIFLVMAQLVRRFGLRTLMLWATGLTAFRWMLTGALPESLPVMLFAQLLHAASFGVFHATAIALFHKFFVGRHQGKGQALYSSLSFGAGGAFGALYSGMAWDSLGAAQTYYMAAVQAVLATWIAWRWIRN
ncbi:MAG: MFS transporter [Gammaproteobacteria bacterium]|nr:MFS transporter [Gammaproteobacteria bacterium]MCW8993703.1 MFS transporter [Gammaproteobacteria bacterium]